MALNVPLVLSGVCMISCVIYLLSTAGLDDPATKPDYSGIGRKRESTLEYNACCAYPCHHGICMEDKQFDFKCDCTNTGYFGRRCQRPYWRTWFVNLLRPSPAGTHELVSHGKWLWSIINRVYSIRAFIMKVVLQVRTGILDMPPLYSGLNAYPTLDTMFNITVHARVLPPVPADCPTPMGTKGPKELPPIKVVVEKLFRRTHFKPCPIRSNALFASYAQHFTHMFFKTAIWKSPIFTWGHQNVDMTHIYGNDLETENSLRTFERGQLKSQMINGEEFPMFTSQVPVEMVNPLNLTRIFALGHRFFNTLPTLALFSTIYLREHNRVAAILEAAHPSWDDNRIFQTTKLILLGQTLKITVEDYVQHLSNYHIRLLFDPEILHQERLQYQNRIHYEFNVLYHWHPLMPDSFNISNATWVIEDWLYNSTNVLLQFGTRNFIEGLVKTRAGQITAGNHGNNTLHVAEILMHSSRLMRLQPFNQYRKRYRLEPYTSFLQLTGGDVALADALRELYHDVDAVELYPGLMAEKRRSRSMFGETIVEMGSPSSLQGLFGNMFSSPNLWRPSTFGGEVGFNIVKSATLKRLFCNNLPPPCPRISFKTEGENFDTVDDVPVPPAPNLADTRRKTDRKLIKSDLEMNTEL